MNRRELMLAAFAAGGEAARFMPVQVQKLFFLVDREIPALVNGPHFHFQPYDYGPFDSAVYSELEALSMIGLVEIVPGYYRSYALTAEGYQQGLAQLAGTPPVAKDFIQRAAQWVKALSFSQLVSAIYQKYPEMKVASVFRDN